MVHNSGAQAREQMHSARLYVDLKRRKRRERLMMITHYNL